MARIRWPTSHGPGAGTWGGGVCSIYFFTCPASTVLSCPCPCNIGMGMDMGMGMGTGHARSTPAARAILTHKGLEIDMLYSVPGPGQEETRSVICRKGVSRSDHVNCKCSPLLCSPSNKAQNTQNTLRPFFAHPPLEYACSAIQYRFVAAFIQSRKSFSLRSNRRVGGVKFT